jgi:hypothetical protein
MNNLVLLEKNDSNLILKLTLLLLILFVFLTIIVYNIYKGTKIILPNLSYELREKSNFHLLKSIGWSFIITLIFSWIVLSENKEVKYAVNKAIKI